ncbi:hypothetical protein GO730_12800 [Spirosoma sp. HMF3257]|uniref:Outer membrane beta-barrel protein n=1 Tax=Spirosoma telluris TaxID=2183553 RepID=A0A327NHM2_9BACT|nr:hypothetical protein [Spirosoma telluris]RAI74880.1 hypothetical protein HMF3257_12715 [Spirosoma telluris]
MKWTLPSLVLLTLCYTITVAQQWQGQIGINLAALPGRSFELATAWSPNLNRWAFTFNAGYTYQNHANRIPSGYVCDCGFSALNTSGAFVKVGGRVDAIRSIKPQARIGLPIGIILIGSQYQQEGTIRSIAGGQDRYSTQSAQGFILSGGLTAALNIRLAARWNVDLGIQKFIGFKKRDDYLLFANYMTYQPGIGLTNWKNFRPGLQGIVTVNYRLNGL